MAYNVKRTIFINRIEQETDSLNNNRQMSLIIKTYTVTREFPLTRSQLTTGCSPAGGGERVKSLISMA